MRDRLVELLCNVKCEGEECFGNCPHRIGQKCNKVQRLEMCSIFTIAEYLLENGVVVPPCKVGSKVYYLTSIDTEKELNVYDIFEGVVLSTAYDGKDIWICAHYTNGLYYYHIADDFGKTVFLTREEAEAALAERREG